MENVMEALSQLQSGDTADAIRGGAAAASIELRQVADKEPVIHRLADVLEDFAQADEETRASVVRKIFGAAFIVAGKLMAQHEPDDT